MRDFVLALMTLIIVILGIKIIMVDVRVRNVEQTVKRCEMDYHAMASENAKLQRINDQNIRLLTDGTWITGGQDD